MTTREYNKEVKRVNEFYANLPDWEVPGMKAVLTTEKAERLETIKRYYESGK